MTETAILEKIAKPSEMICFHLLDTAGAGDYFETDQLVTDEPTKSIRCNMRPFTRFLLKDISYYMLPDNAVTYKLALFSGAEAVDLSSFSKLAYESPAAQAKDTLYHRCNNEDTLPRIIILDTPGRLYYSLDWSGAPGNCPGFIRVRGIKLA